MIRTDANRGYAGFSCSIFLCRFAPKIYATEKNARMRGRRVQAGRGLPTSTEPPQKGLLVFKDPVNTLSIAPKGINMRFAFFAIVTLPFAALAFGMLADHQVRSSCIMDAVSVTTAGELPPTLNC